MSAITSPNLPHATPLRLGVPQTHDGITIVPLLVAALPQRAYITLDEAMPLGFTIQEIDSHGHVPELLVRNPLTTDVLLYDGEEVVGGHIVARGDTMNLYNDVAAELKTKQFFCKSLQLRHTTRATYKRGFHDSIISVNVHETVADIVTKGIKAFSYC